MSSLYQYVLNPEFVVMVLAAVAAFATVASFVLPLLTGDHLDARMKNVASERERLRAERITALADEQHIAKLRREPKSFMNPGRTGCSNQAGTAADQYRGYENRAHHHQ